MAFPLKKQQRHSAIRFRLRLTIPIIPVTNFGS